MRIWNSLTIQIKNLFLLKQLEKLTHSYGLNAIQIRNLLI